MKYISRLLVLVLMISILIPASSDYSYASKEIGVSVNGQMINYTTSTGKPFATNGRTLVPLRATFETMGYIVSWNSDKKMLLKSHMVIAQ